MYLEWLRDFVFEAFTLSSFFLAIELGRFYTIIKLVIFLALLGWVI
jgi:hypothetical protein